MAIAASSVTPTNSLEDFRIEFNNLVSDVTGITATNKFTENIIFEGATADAHETTLTVTDPTADRTLTLPNATDTIVGRATTDTLTNKTITAAIVATSFDMNGAELILDADADTSITSDTDDQIDIRIAGADDFQFTANTFTAQTGSTIAAQALTATTGVFSSDITGLTINATGDTAADDAAAIGYTSVEGLILTGQGSTNDVTIKNDADADVIEIPTGTVNVTMAGTLGVIGVVSGAGFTAGSAVLAEAELELLDGLTAGTAIASKVVTTDASIDTSGQRNLTISGELDAATLDISGAIDVAGNSVLASVDVTGVATASTFEPDGDTAAADNAAIGYTSVEGLILTGQGSTNDVTIKNDVDADVIEIPTGTTNVTIAGTLTTGGTITATTSIGIGSAVLAEAELELLDGLTAGTAVASKVVTTDASIDTTGQRNLTISGELDAATLDISGAIDVAGNSVLASVDVTGVATASTFEPDGDTAADDAAAIGYTSVEGLILTGQGSTNDVTIKNDADADVIEIPTGTTNVTIAGDLTISGDDLFMATNTSGAALIGDGTNFNPVVISGDAAIATNGALTIASTAIESGMLNNNIISGQTALASGLAATDEILVSDAGTLKRMDVSILTEVTDGSATALAIALG